MVRCIDEALLSEARKRLRPLVIRLSQSKGGVVLEGDLATYGYTDENYSDLISYVQDLAVGLDFDESAEWPLVSLPNGKASDIQWISYKGERYCVLLDASDLHAALFRRQQTANEGHLLDEERQRYAAALEASQQNLNRRVVQLESMRSNQRTLLNGLIHDLGTPLTSILGYVSLLDRQLLQVDAREKALLAIKSGAQYIQTLREDLLALAECEGDDAGTKQADPINLNQLGARIKTLFLPLAGEKNLDFNVSVDVVNENISMSDGFRLERIVMNLVSNAIRYTPKGFVHAYLHANEDYLTIEISDSGVGIAVEDQQALFQPFARPTSSDQQGVGLGLYLVKEFVHAMSGTLELQSKPGEGTLVKVTIPHAQTKPDPVAPGRQFTSTQRKLSNHRIVIIEDNEAVADLLGIVLGDIGFEVKRLIDPARVEGFANDYQPGAFVIDYRLPGRSGLHLCQDLRLAGYEGLIVLCTGERDQSLTVSAKHVGVDWFLTKPFNMEALQHAFLAARDPGTFGL